MNGNYWGTNELLSTYLSLTRRNGSGGCPHLIIAAKDLCRTCALQGVISILGLRMSGVFTNHARAGKRQFAQTAEPA